MRKYHHGRAAVLAATFATALHAQSSSIDVSVLHQRMIDACPILWEDITDDIDPSTVAGDHWQGDTVDRDAFIAFIDGEMGASAPDANGLAAMADDLPTVAAECATQRLGLLDGLINKLPNDALAALAAVTEEMQGSATALSQRSFNHRSTAADYAIDGEDLGSPLVVSIELTGNNVNISEMPLVEMAGIVHYTVSQDDGVGDQYSAKLVDSNGVEVWTGFVKGDSISIAYDGESRIVLDERSTIEVVLTLNADEGGTSTRKVFTNAYEVQRNVGGAWSPGSSDRFVAPFDGVYEISFVALLMWNRQAPEIRKNGVAVVSGATWGDLSYMLPGNHHTLTGTFELKLSDEIEFYVSHWDTTLRYLFGDAAGDESRVDIRLIRRTR